jgi:hypothetical protein
MASDAVYKNLAEYKQYCDYERQNGREPTVLTLDNDFIAAYGHDEEGRTAYPVLIETEPYTLLREALTLLGIPHEEV